VSDNPDPKAEKIQQLADEAVAAGRKFLESDSGKKVAELAETGFAKADELLDKAMASETGQQAKQMLDKALASEPAQQVKDLAAQAPDSAKQVLSTHLGRNVAIGAAAGLAASFVIPFIGPIIGAAMGGGLGYLRTLTKKD
jgi:hypothetical protein